MNSISRDNKRRYHKLINRNSRHPREYLFTLPGPHKALIPHTSRQTYVCRCVLAKFAKSPSTARVNLCLFVIYGSVCLFRNTGTLLQLCINAVRSAGHGTLYLFEGFSFSYVLFSIIGSSHLTSSMSIVFRTKRLIWLSPGGHHCVQ